MRSYPRYWKRLISRGVLHESLQLEHAHIVHQRSGAIVRHLQEFGILNPEVASPCRERATESALEVYGCLHCEVPCKTKAGEAVHQNLKHGVRSKLRFLCSGSSCPCCLREYHVPERVHHHLRTSRRCRLELLARDHSLTLQLVVGPKSMGPMRRRAIALCHFKLVWGHNCQPRWGLKMRSPMWILSSASTAVCHSIMTSQMTYYLQSSVQPSAVNRSPGQPFAVLWTIHGCSA